MNCVQQIFRAYAPDLFGTSVIVAIPAAFVVAGVIGILIERCMIRFLRFIFGSRYRLPAHVMAPKFNVRNLAVGIAEINGGGELWSDFSTR